MRCVYVKSVKDREDILPLLDLLGQNTPRFEFRYDRSIETIDLIPDFYVDVGTHVNLLVPDLVRYLEARQSLSLQLRVDRVHLSSTIRDIPTKVSINYCVSPGEANRLSGSIIFNSEGITNVDKFALPVNVVEVNVETPQQPPSTTTIVFDSSEEALKQIELEKTKFEGYQNAVRHAEETLGELEKLILSLGYQKRQ